MRVSVHKNEGNEQHQQRKHSQISVTKFVGTVTRLCMFPVIGKGHCRVTSPRCYMINVVGAHPNGPMRRKMMLLETNEIAYFGDDPWGMIHKITAF